MEPRFQYAQTSDGVNLAYWTLGEGPPLLLPPPLGFSHIQLEWEYPELRACYERLARTFQIIRFDYRGSGLSDRDITQYSQELCMLDLETIADRLGFDKFAIYALGGNAHVAMVYAAIHPERITHLFLWDPAPWHGPDPKVRELLDRDWELYSETFAHVVLGWSQGARAHQFAGFIRASLTPELWKQIIEVNIDAGELVERVVAPTLLMDRPQRRGFDPKDIRGLASSIPNARVVFLGGRDVHPFLGDFEEPVNAIEEFFRETSAGAAAKRSLAVAAVVTILFTDITDSTALTQRLGDAKAQELVRAHNTIVREALAAQGGTEIKHTGDGIMASFPTASGSLECAVAIQRGVALRQAQGGDMDSLNVHVGLNAGEPVAEESDLFGTSVQLARRICDHATSGQILASDVVRQLAAGKGFLFADIGEVVPKGFEDPVRLYEVRWREEG